MKRGQQARRALGTDCLLTFVTEDDFDAEALFEKLWACIEAFEQRFSRFIQSSELSQLNNADGVKIQLSIESVKLLEESKKYSVLMEGLYNPFVLPALQKSGYVGSWPHPDKYDESLNYSDSVVVPISGLVTGKDWAQIPKGSAIDLGGIGKGYLLDSLAELVEKEEITGYWMSLGGDIICAGSDVDSAAWQIGIEPVDILSSFEANVNIKGRKTAIATSGTNRRNGLNWHHIIDPKTGKSAETDIITCSVVADTATKADVFAKCLLILGSADAKDFAHDKKIDNFLLQCRTKSDTVSVIRQGDAWTIS
jgi:FAD:protein FMN transferase